MWKRVFSKKQQPESVSKSHRYPVQMWEAIEALAKEHGESANAFVILVLDQYLQVQLAEGKIKLPAHQSDEKIA